MTVNLCPLCQHPNPASAKACQACGVGLVLVCPSCSTVNEAGLTRCRYCATLLRDDAIGAPEPVRPSAPPPEPAPARPPLLPAERAEKKARIRAAVRRAQLSNAAPQGSAATSAADVLVLDSDGGTRKTLCGLLTRFGFTTHPAVTLAQASQLLEAGPFVAAFLEILFDGSDHGAGVEFCHRVKQSNSPLAGRPPALFVLSLRPRPVDKVRASLAGCDVFLTKPPTRGGVARALESCGLPMPADPRRHDRDSRGPADRLAGAETVTDDPAKR